MILFKENNYLKKKQTFTMQEHSNEFTVTLLSNASDDLFPNNNVFNFTNVLARQLNLPAREGWRVSLQSISLSTISDDPKLQSQRTSLQQQEAIYAKKKYQSLEKFENSDPSYEQDFAKLYKQSQSILKKKVTLFHTANTVFVECAQIIPKFEDKRYLSSFIIPPLSSGADESYTYEPISEEYFNLESEEINQFSINILNSNGEKIYRSVAQPTIIVLKFKKMENLQKSYSLNLSNGDQKPSKFYAKLPPLFLQNGTQNNWEMAVSRVSFIPLFQKFPTGNFSISVVKDADDFMRKFTVPTWEEYLETKEVAKMGMVYNQNYTPDNLMIPIVKALQGCCKKLGLEGAITQNQNNHLEIKVAPNPLPEEEKKKNYLLILPAELIYVLGFDNEGIYFKNGYGAIPSAYGKTITARRRININFLIPQNLLIYANCVAPSLVGNIYGRYLTHIPIDRKAKKTFDIPYIVYEPKNLEFHPLEVTDVNNVLIQMLKSDGTEPEFMVDNIQANISILIRKIEK